LAISPENGHFFGKLEFNSRANRRNCYIFSTAKKNGPPDIPGDPFQNWTLTSLDRRN